MFDRNLLYALIISVVIVVAFQMYYQYAYPPPQKKRPVPTGVEEPPKPVPPQVKKEQPEPPPKPAPSSAAQPEQVKPEQPKVAEVRLKIDTPLYEAVVSSWGGKIVSFRLKKYRVNGNMGPDSDNLVNLDEPNGAHTGGPTILFTGRSADGRSAEFGDDGLGFAVDTPKGGVLKLDDPGQKKSISLRAKTPSGIAIVKTFHFSADLYSVGVAYELTNDSASDENYWITFPWRKTYKGENPKAQFNWNSAEMLINGELKDYYFKDIKGDEEPSGKVEWVALGDTYFMKSLAFADRPAQRVTLFKPEGEGYARVWIRYGSVDLPSKKPVTINLAAYLGPKEDDALHAAGHNLDKARVYSYNHVLDLMATYLMKFLKLCNEGTTVAGIKIPGTHNYGIDIIFLTILIKILFIPLSHKSMKSMKRMQDLQPQMAKIKEKFKDDKTAMNKATMDLFREHKVSPLGGCWPMFLQIPVFIALYQALSWAIELRHAPFMCVPSIYLCLNDLSAPDPYYVTPILMGGTMALQQWMTPSAGDPTQRKMMMLMPVFFTYIFLSFPSGLVLYWLVSNVLSIAQQYVTNRMAQ
ncbi:MAG: membrane protein insertase YidC [Thermodesulfobacteriota bacterium]